MEKIEWKREYEIGIGVIDYQHRKLIRLIGDIQEYQERTDYTDDILDLIFDELCDYTDYHFSTEEKYMESLNYTNLAEHKIKHQNFINNIKLLKDKFQRREKDIMDNLAVFLNDWLMTHIFKEDLQIKQYVEQGGGLV